MIDTLNETIVYWHWIVFGIFLFILKFTTKKTLFFGFSLSAMIVSIFDLFFKSSISFEFSLWISLSILSLAIWIKWIKTPILPQTHTNNIDLDTLGIVLEEIAPQNRGRVIFDKPVLGNSSWYAISKTKIKIGSRIQIVKIHEELLEVKSA